MHRLFVALRPPASIRAALTEAMHGIAGARWQDDDQLHLTLRFIGEVDGPTADDLVGALGQVGGSAVTARIAGVGRFEHRGRTDTLWAGVEPRAPLAALHRKIDRALVSAGLVPERRVFAPHITLARLARGANVEVAVARWRADNSLLATDPFQLDRLILYRSELGRAGARYEPIAYWPLAWPAANTPHAIRSPDAPDGSVL